MQADETDAFVTKLNATGNALIYSTYLGGSGADMGNGIAVNSSGSAFVVGSTDSTNFRLQNALYLTGFVFVTSVNPAGTSLAYSTYLSGGSGDSGNGIAANSSGTAYVTGFTASNNFPTFHALQPTNAGGNKVARHGSPYHSSRCGRRFRR